MSPRSCSELRERASGGFTLLEVLVAISIAAIVLTTVYGVFTSISGAKERLEKDGEVYQRARVVFDRLGRELRGVCPVGGPERKGVFRTGTDADGNPTLELTTSATAQLGVQQTGIALIRYTLAPDPENRSSRALFRTEQSALLSDEAIRQNGAIRLATGVDRLEWRFLHQDQWRDELDAAQDGLPLLAELTLTMTDARGEKLPFRSAFELPDITWR
ncbi:MAG: prepilin-type N-terminal cleavage/methylation domain-containing protein [Desulfuromonadales bacterium]|nr:prepilin-type N-terminal cleavage/methylation domain-containing protein [Desulfuromonadales bacterium]